MWKETGNGNCDCEMKINNVKTFKYCTEQENCFDKHNARFSSKKYTETFSGLIAFF